MPVAPKAPKKLRSNSAQTAEHRIRILDAAAKCFMRYGYESTSIDDVATEMGSTKGLVYYSFKSKAELFFAVYERSIENALLHLQPIADGEDAGLEKLSAVCEKHIILLMATLPYHVVTRLGVEMHTSRAMTPPQHRKLLELINLRDRYEHLFVSLIDAGIRDGSIRNVNVSLAAKTVLGAINSVSMWYRPRMGETEADRGKMAREITELVISGLENSASKQA